MRVSIIVPSYNQGGFLNATLASVLAQRHNDLEIIVNDGGSTDSSVAVLRSFGSRIRWKSEPDTGQTDAINQGLRTASGEILAYLNSDDVLAPGALEAVLRHFREHPRCLALYGKANHLHADGSVMEEYPTAPWDYRRLFASCFVCQPATFWRRTVHTRFGYFDESLDYSMDYEFWLRVGTHIPFHYLDEHILAGSRLHEETKTLRHRVPAHREILSTVLRHADDSTWSYNWLKNLASLQATEDGFPPSRDPANHREHVRAFVRHTITYAEQFRIVLNRPIMAELEQLLTSAFPTS